MPRIRHGERLAEVRAALGLSLREMAARLDISHVELLEREKGRRKIDTVFLEAVAVVAGKSAHDLAAQVMGGPRRRRRAA